MWVSAVFNAPEVLLVLYKMAEDVFQRLQAVFL